MPPVPFAVVIPTKGRPEILGDTLESLARQTLVPNQVIVSSSCPSDLPRGLPPLLNCEVVVGPVGSCCQRNIARSRLRGDVELVFLLDDDLELAADYLEQMVHVFQAYPEMGLLGGNLIAEGVTRRNAVQILANAVDHYPEVTRPVRALYGCNICVRTDIFRTVDFDENLRLVGWLEDFDWSVRASRYGAIMCTSAARLVHLKVSSGRVSGYRFGYSQVLNPYYLYRKGTIPTCREVFERHWLRLLVSNFAGLIRGDKKVDRWGRLRGNVRAFGDIISGHPDPTRIELL